MGALWSLTSGSETDLQTPVFTYSEFVFFSSTASDLILTTHQGLETEMGGWVGGAWNLSYLFSSKGNKSQPQQIPPVSLGPQ